jgi:pentose-5-phosphate-3-epimerase
MDCHMMVSKPEQVKYPPSQRHRLELANGPVPQWVDAIAHAGGKLYCFHIEATCESARRMPVSRECPKIERLNGG